MPRWPLAIVLFYIKVLRCLLAFGQIGSDRNAVPLCSVRNGHASLIRIKFLEKRI